MKINAEDKTVDISVREIAFSAESPVSDGYISRRLRARIGQEVHATYQQTTEGLTEYFVDFYVLVDEWYVQIRGRVDVVHKEDNSIHLEEIKSTTQPLNIVEKDPAHVLQLQIYCHYFEKFEKLRNITADLIMIDPKGHERRIEVSPEPIGDFLVDHLRKLITGHLKEQKEREERKKRAETFSFPYDDFRPHQLEIMKKITNLLVDEPRIMLHAPPGIGKTITTLYPALVHAIATGKRLFIITSKTTQQLVYREAIRDLQSSGAQFKAINISAKGKMCHLDDYDCYDFECPYFEKYINTDNTSTISGLLNLDLIERQPVETIAKQRNICPFEISLDAALYCDVILSDFNYIFHPRVKFQRFQHEFSNSILIIDEAHNLVSRSIEYYTSTLGVNQIQGIITSIRQSPVSNQLKYQLRSLLKRIMKFVQQLKDQITNLELEHSIVSIDKNVLIKYQKKLDELCIDYLDSFPIPPSRKDNLIKFADHLKFFTLLLRETDTPEFEEVYDVLERQVRILCKSSAKKLEEEMKNFDTVIVQSATLEPLEYYQTMLGLPASTSILRYSYPFNPDNRIYLIDNSISTTYKERYLFLEQLATLIASVISLRNGNYLVFFSSFEYLNRVYKLLKPKITHNILRQSSDMSDRERDHFLETLHKSNNNLVLAVMGGIFSEGIDYKGDLASGAFVIGPGLPKITFDQELRKQYFDETYQKGFDFAYKFPGFAKVIQAGGRVFRKDDDKGFVIFVGHRFATDQYLPLIPENYRVEIGNVYSKIADFWSKKSN